MRLGPAIALACALAIAGCAVIPRYPSALPPLLAGDERLERVPDIRGRYVDSGEGLAPSSRSVGRASLTALLHGGPREPAADRVDVTLAGDGTLELRSVRGDAVVATARRHAGSLREGGTPANYVGNRGFAVLALGAEGAGAGGVGMAGADESLWLRKAADGSLIALHRVLFGGVLVIVPFAGRVDTWYRFAPVGASE